MNRAQRLIVAVVCWALAVVFWLVAGCGAMEKMATHDDSTALAELTTPPPPGLGEVSVGFVLPIVLLGAGLFVFFGGKKGRAK